MRMPALINAGEGLYRWGSTPRLYLWGNIRETNGHLTSANRQTPPLARAGFPSHFYPGEFPLNGDRTMPLYGYDCNACGHQFEKLSVLPARSPPARPAIAWIRSASFRSSPTRPRAAATLARRPAKAAATAVRAHARLIERTACGCAKRSEAKSEAGCRVFGLRRPNPELRKKARAHRAVSAAQSIVSRPVLRDGGRQRLCRFCWAAGVERRAKGMSAKRKMLAPSSAEDCKHGAEDALANLARQCAARRGGAGMPGFAFPAALASRRTACSRRSTHSRIS